MLAQCWASVVDGGPTLNQHPVSVSCLLDTTGFIISDISLLLCFE